MSRVQLALNVSDLESAVEFYSKLFGATPAKRRPGYANFAIDEPPLKLVLMQSDSVRGFGVQGALNHLGIEVPGPQEVRSATERFGDAGINTSVEQGTTCCYALQDKVWVNDPDGAPWEVYAVLADSSSWSDDIAGDGRCCTAATEMDGIDSLPADVACC